MQKKAFLALLLSALACQGMASDQTELDRSVQYICTHSEEMHLREDVFRLDWNADLVMLLLSGQNDRAIDAIASDLGNLAHELALFRKDRACKDEDPENFEQARARIYPALRVLAAVNHKTPIPGLKDNPEVQQLLQQAIADDPAHYQQLLERSKNWDHGIR